MKQIDLPHLEVAADKLAAPSVGCTDAVAEQPMDSMSGHRRLAADLFVVRSCSDIDDDGAVVGHPLDAIAIESLVLAFAQSDLVAAVFVLVLLARPNVDRALDEPSKTVVAADLLPMFVAVVAIFMNVHRRKKKQGNMSKLRHFGMFFSSVLFVIFHSFSMKENVKSLPDIFVGVVDLVAFSFQALYTIRRMEKEKLVN